jgi:predicted dehydrogenase
LPETEIVALADAQDAGREKMRQQLGLSTAYADYRTMLVEVRPELVAICPRYADQHRDMALAAVAAGARGIYCEKPAFRTPAEADEVLAACEAAGTKFAIAHRNHYHPALPACRKAIESGAIGRLLEFRGRGKEDQRGGVQDLWVLGTHVFDLARYFGGDPLACSALLSQGHRSATPADVVAGAEGVGPIAGDSLHARYDLAGGVPFYFDSIRGAGVPAAGFGLQLIGTQGVIDLRVDAEPVAHYMAGNPFQPVREPRTWVPISSAGIAQPEPLADIRNLVSQHELAARDLLAAIDEHRPPLCSAQDGRVLTEMVMAALASHVQGGVRVAWPLADRNHPFDRWRA